MFDELRTFSIQGGFFDDNKDLTLFQENVNVNVVYGRNGSGKTTIAKGIRELAKTAEQRKKEEEEGRKPEYVVSTVVAIPEEMKESIYVFDEDFIGDHVKVSKDGVEAIVMIGEQVDISTQIKDKTAILKKKTEELTTLTTLRERYNDKGDVISPEYAYNRIWEALREEDGWADREREIRQTTMRGRVTESVVNKLMEMELPKETSAAILQKLRENLVLYLSAKDELAIVWRNPLEPDLYDTENTKKLPKSLNGLNTLLAKPLESPELSEREYRLLSMITMTSQHPQHFSQQNTKQMVEEKWAFCPLCLRDVDERDRAGITETLKHILNKEAEEYEKVLAEELEVFTDKEESLPVFPGELNKKEIDAAKVALENDIGFVSRK